MIFLVYLESKNERERMDLKISGKGVLFSLCTPADALNMQQGYTWVALILQGKPVSKYNLTKPHQKF